LGGLKDAQAGVSVQALCRTHAISEATFSTWRTKYAGLDVRDVKNLRRLEDEHRRLKQMVAEQALDSEALKALTATSWYGPRRRGRQLRRLVHALDSVSDGCASSWTWIGTRYDTSAAD
jgi:putative transposase